MLRFYRVRGESMLPLLADGDVVLAWDAYGLVGRPRIGDMVIFNSPYHGILVKQVESLDPAGGVFRVRGTRPISTDSQDFGNLPFSALLGKVIWRVPKKSG